MTRRGDVFAVRRMKVGMIRAEILIETSAKGVLWERTVSRAEVGFRVQNEMRTGVLGCRVRFLAASSSRAHARTHARNYIHALVKYIHAATKTLHEDPCFQTNSFQSGALMLIPDAISSCCAPKAHRRDRRHTAVGRLSAGT